MPSTDSMLLNFRSCAVFVSKATSVFGRDSWRNIVWSVSNSSGSFTLKFGTDRVGESTIVNTLDISRSDVPLAGFINSFHSSSTCFCQISRKHRLTRGCKKILDTRARSFTFGRLGILFPLCQKSERSSLKATYISEGN